MRTSSQLNASARRETSSETAHRGRDGRGVDISEFFAQNARRLERSISARVAAPFALVEDACSFAWCQLLSHPEVRLDRDGFWWLHKVALREAWRLSSRKDEVNVDVIEEHAAGEDLQTIAEWHERLASLRRIPERQRSVLLLHAFGFSYAEISRITGCTRRTVDRQLRRARQRAEDAGVATLTAREQQVLDGLVDGDSFDAIGAQLGIARETVNEYAQVAYRRLGVRRRSEAIAVVRRRGM